MFFDGGIHKEMTREIIKTLPKRDQDQVFQNLYDKGYSVPEIAKSDQHPSAHALQPCRCPSRPQGRQAGDLNFTHPLRSKNDLRTRF